MNKYVFLLAWLLFSCDDGVNSTSRTSENPSKNSKQTSAVIEIPAGTLDKFELDKETNTIEHEHKNGKPRVVQYLAYPANYGYIPNTLLPKKDGGDGDPLDVIVLGAAVNRNDTLPIKIIGALKLLDRGEQDDKLIAVSENTPFSKVDDLDELNQKFQGVSSIIDTWFTNYKGKGKMETQGFLNAAEAKLVLKKAKEGYAHSDQH